MYPPAVQLTKAGRERERGISMVLDVINERGRGGKKGEERHTEEETFAAVHGDCGALVVAQPVEHFRIETCQKKES